MNLVFLGPPGVGKWTAAQKLALEWAIPPPVLPLVQIETCLVAPSDIYQEAKAMLLDLNELRRVFSPECSGPRLKPFHDPGIRIRSLIDALCTGNACEKPCDLIFEELGP